eukprot:m.28275 g.28275  ORF g.28275 m.28275 type:complete len:165 (-) comp7987_c0_seq1:148-642(-)
MAMLTGYAGSSNYERSLSRIKEENGGELPSELYLKTNAQLSDMIQDMSGKRPGPQTSKKVLVKRLEKLLEKKGVNTKKRKADEEGSSPVTTKKAKGSSSSFSLSQIAEMKRVLSMDADTMASRYKHRELYTIWNNMGYKAQFPDRSSKATVVEKMRKFAAKNSC